MRASRFVDYEKISPSYDVSRGANPEAVKKLLRVLHAGSHSVLLDMGCGTGNYAAALHKAANEVVGVDISLGMIRRARAKYSGLRFACADVARLPFSSQAFDGAFAIQTLHHVREKVDFLREARRVLKREGQIAIHTCSHEQIRAFWWYYYFPEGLEIDLARIPDSEEIVRMLQRAGFSDIDREICYHDSVVVREAPERYLDKSYRDGISTFSLLGHDDVEAGLQRLRWDITSGVAEEVIQPFKNKVTNEVGGSTIICGCRNDE